jgi:hypothetical protein
MAYLHIRHWRGAAEWSTFRINSNLVIAGPRDTGRPGQAKE